MRQLPGIHDAGILPFWALPNVALPDIPRAPLTVATKVALSAVFGNDISRIAKRLGLKQRRHEVGS
jgi:hypothetical protein